jgi:GT2 family glycosyltransferase
MGERQPDDAPITIAVVSWNTRALLAECLDSLREDVRSGLADVWVHDNASSDGSAEMVRSDFPWVNLIASSENLGFGAAVNEVAARTRSAWIAPANADLRFSQHALRRLVAEADEHLEAGLIAPRLILPDGSTQHSVYPFPTITFTLAYVSGAIGKSTVASITTDGKTWHGLSGHSCSCGALRGIRSEASMAPSGCMPKIWILAGV